MQETTVLSDVWWQGAVQVVLKEEVLLVLCAAKFRVRKRSEAMERRRKISVASTRCIGAYRACVRCAS